MLFYRSSRNSFIRLHLYRHHFPFLFINNNALFFRATTVALRPLQLHSPHDRGQSSWTLALNSVSMGPLRPFFSVPLLFPSIIFLITWTCNMVCTFVRHYCYRWLPRSRRARSSSWTILLLLPSLSVRAQVSSKAHRMHLASLLSVVVGSNSIHL